MRQKALALLLGLPLVALPLAASGDPDPAIERAYKSKCASCHGADGKGATKQGEKMKIRDMTTAAWKKEFTEEKIKAAILDGVQREKDGVKQEMKPLRDKLTPEQVAGLAAYVRAMK